MSKNTTCDDCGADLSHSGMCGNCVEPVDYAQLSAIADYYDEAQRLFTPLPETSGSGENG